ncbi:polysaccharide deacetylase family protein [Massilia sp. METH4]|uniref:polysaccharide deacetylase family protein n=1 Tax=Massilia sp. METH4 TaxID=3123041 RepID=UPI0030CF3193
MKQPDHAADAAPLLEKSLLSLLSPGGRHGLSILIYHRVLPEKDPLFPSEVDAAEFSAQVGMLKSHFNVLPLLEAVRRSKEGTLPPRAAAITFDDGYADNAEVALPILRRHGLHATFFVATGFLNGGRMWNDSVYELVRRAPGGVLDATPLGLGRHALQTLAERRQAIPALIGQLKYLPMAERQRQVDRLVALAGVALPDDLMMTTAQVRKLHAAGMGIGAHTVNHPILARLPDAEAREEIAQGKLALEDMIGAPVHLFAYPNGKPGEDYEARHVAMARDLRFEGAVSTSWGASRRRPDPFQLPRFTPWDRSRLRFVLRMARNLTTSAQLA